MLRRCLLACVREEPWGPIATDSCLDRKALREFRIYWLVIRMVSGLLRQRWLGRIKAASERTTLEPKITAHVAAGRLKMLAENPLQLQTGYYFVHAPDARAIHLLKLLRDWAVAARPFRAGKG
jgi:hypothetical protein